MEKLSRNVIACLERQGFIIASTLDENGEIHCSAKGIVGIEKTGKVYIIDLYCQHTFSNLKRNPNISITVIDESRFEGYTLKGKAKIVQHDKVKDHIIKRWEEKIIQRISARVIQDVKVDRKTTHHPEARFPQPCYLIVVEVDKIVDLTPGDLKPSAFKEK